jgi:hypothetical protein
VLANDPLPVPFFLVVAVDLPAVLLWILWLASVPDSGLPDHLVAFLLYGIVGGAWWYSIGWIGVTVHSRLAVSSSRTRFVAGLLISTTLVVLVSTVQFVATLPNTAHDGCASAGIPVSFFRGCYGTLGSYSPVQISYGALIFDGAAWLILALIFSFWLSRRAWQGK